MEHNGVDVKQIKLEDLDKWYTVEKASKYLGVPVQSVKYRCNNGRLRFVKIGKNIFIDPASVEDLRRELKYKKKFQEKCNAARERWLRRKLEEAKSSAETAVAATEAYDAAPSENGSPGHAPNFESSMQLGANGSQV